MRNALMFALLLVAGLAGCLSDGDDDSDGSFVDSGLGSNGSGDLLESWPVVDADAMLADHEDFVTTYNHRAANSATHLGSRDALVAYFESFGLEVYRQEFEAGGLAQENIIAIKWGQIRDEWVVVGGHYDTTTTLPPNGATSQGAYDDGSGTMMTVHLAKAFAETNTRYTMAFVAYDGEERGTQGARAFVHAFQGVNPDMVTPYGVIDVVGAVDLDMIGLNWPGVNAPINFITNSDDIFDGSSGFAMDELGFPEEQIVRKDGLLLGSSDYARFWEVTEEFNGPIPTIFYISDFEEIGLPSPTPPQAHTPTPLGVYPFWHLEDTWLTMELMAGGPVLGPANLQSGFQAAVDIASETLWRMATEESYGSDAVVV